MKFIRALRKKNTIVENAGFITGYYFDRKEYKNVYDAVKKFDRAWKTPVFLKTLLYNPSLLMLQENWVVDQTAFNKAIEYFTDTFGLKDESNRLVELFNNLNHITFIDLQDYLLEKEDIHRILETISYYGSKRNHFEELIRPLQTKYKYYAEPNNYEFERLNAGIISSLYNKYPKLIPLDDVLRAPVYEDLNLKNIKKLKESANIMTDFISASKNILRPIPYIPQEWTVDGFISLYNSKGAKQLRNIINILKTDQALTPDRVELYIQNMNELSKSLSPGNRILNSIGGLIVSGGAAVATIAIPWLFATSAMGISISGTKLVEGIIELEKKGNLKWLELAKMIASWD